MQRLVTNQKGDSPSKHNAPILSVKRDQEPNNENPIGVIGGGEYELKYAGRGNVVTASNAQRLGLNFEGFLQQCHEHGAGGFGLVRWSAFFDRVAQKAGITVIGRNEQGNGAR